MTALTTIPLSIFHCTYYDAGLDLAKKEFIEWNVKKKSFLTGR
jgi:hypothetical protein